MMTNKSPSTVIYLACPYTHPDARLRLERFNRVTAAAAALIRRGHVVFSPITMTHPIDLVLAGESNTLGSDFWVQFDQTFMDRCDSFVLLPLDGWQESRGVLREMDYFITQGKSCWVLSQDSELEPLQHFLKSVQLEKLLNQKAR